MSARKRAKVSFADKAENIGGNSGEVAESQESDAKKKHTLDSDEEDDDYKTTRRLNIENVSSNE